MATRRVLGVIAMLLATLAVPDAPAVARWKCRSDKQCKGGECNASGRCCDTFAGDVACGATCCNTLLGGACCNNACRDILNDGLNCGGCDNHCPATTICQNGICGCPGGLTLCVGTQECTDLQNDSQNCGSCGNQCTGGSFCLDGDCVCPDGWSLCGETCVNTQSDRTNCGTCGHACAANEACTGGVCVPACSTDFALCPTDYGESVCCPPISPWVPGCCRPQDDWVNGGYCCGPFGS